MTRTRVVVTGMGIICPIGNNVDEVWHNASHGISGIAPITLFDATGLDVRFGGEVKNFDPEALLGRREVRRTDRMTHFAIAAASEAVADARLDITDDNRDDIACVIGTGIGGITTLLEGYRNFLTRGARGISPLMLPMMLTDAASGRTSIHFGTRGPNFSISTACATGNNCIGEAAEIIRRGQAKIALAGSTEAAFTDVAMASFNNMTVISRRNDHPAQASRPFDLNRDGFVVSEGAAVLILETLEGALERGAHIYAEICGYGHTSDAHHITSPQENGEGAARAIKLALKDAGVTPEAIDYINAHGTSTQLNDRAETLAIKTAFGEQAYETPISSTKSMTGHLMGSAGSVEAVITIKAMQENFIPPTINLETPDPNCDLNYTPNVGVARELHYAMSNSFGFGGHNAVLVFGKYNGNGHHNHHAD